MKTNLSTVLNQREVIYSRAHFRPNVCHFEARSGLIQMFPDCMVSRELHETKITVLRMRRKYTVAVSMFFSNHASKLCECNQENEKLENKRESRFLNLKAADLQCDLQLDKRM